MITAVISTHNSAVLLSRTLVSLFEAALDGLVGQVIVSDGGSTDGTPVVAEEAGATVMESAGGRWENLCAGAEAARKPWLLFLEAGVTLRSGWEREARSFISRKPSDASNAAWLTEFPDSAFRRMLLAALRFSRSGSRQRRGLLISRSLFQELAQAPVSEAAFLGKLRRPKSLPLLG